MSNLDLGSETSKEPKIEDHDKRPSTEMADDLAALGATVSAVSNSNLERQLLQDISGEDELSGQAGTSGGSSKFDQLMGLADDVRFGKKTPFELQTEQQDVSSDGELPSSDEDGEEYVPSKEELEYSWEDQPGPSQRVVESESEDDEKMGKRKAKKTPSSKKSRPLSKEKNFIDDGNDADFEKRIRRIGAREELEKIENPSAPEKDKSLHNLRNDLKLSSEVWRKLYKYQKTGVRWLCELNEQAVGGILADEMGLGKTIQMISFLRCLDESQQNDVSLGVTGLGATLIVCPTTLMQQWVKEIHTWMPKCRAAVLHSSGSFRGSKSRLISKMAVNRRGGSVLITSYTTFTKEMKDLIKQDWHYVILDEGHKIRNPESQTTLALKELRTPNRIILSGSPMQNSLKELWSLIDFVYPGRLGSLKTFTEKFAVPITQGGYANASEVQAMTAYKCALVLRDAINPFILRRMKKDVQQVLDLPEKNEQVLFCEITAEQRRLYKEYISSRECSRILKGSMDAFVGLIALRKLCNHPDLVTGGPNRHDEFNIIEDPTKEFGWYERSGKMIVVRNLLALWKKGGHKVLLFSQSRQMLNILERLLLVEDYNYLRMDGSTNIGARQTLVQKFNEDPSVTVFLLTTRVGGLGINLTGANKVLIFDPDWNPSTDVQARERAWRIGQNRAVTIYRLLSTGTIEEKIYHRQIFKQFLANRILKDPKQRRFFKTNDLHELFSLTEKEVEGTETATLFATETDEINKDNYFDRHEKQREKERASRRKVKKVEEVEDVEDDIEGETCDLSEERRNRLREIARRIARNPDMAAPCTSTSESTSKKKSRKSKKRLLDGEFEIPYLSRQKRAKVTVDEKEEKEDRKAGDDYVLGRLLKSAGVRSVLQHDDLVGEKPSNDLIEREAENIAKQAAAVLRTKSKSGFLSSLRSGRRMPQTVDNTSDTEGEETMFSGNAEKGSFLSAIRKRKGKHLEGGSDVLIAGGSNDKFSRMADEIRRFMVSKGGKALTNDIVEKFKEKIGPHEQSQFRAILKKISTFNAPRKEWILLEEYQK